MLNLRQVAIWLREKRETEKGTAETSTKEEIIRPTSGKVDKHHSCRWMGVIGLSPFIHFTFIAVEYSQWSWVRLDSAWHSRLELRETPTRGPLCALREIMGGALTAAYLRTAAMFSAIRLTLYSLAFSYRKNRISNKKSLPKLFKTILLH